MTIIVCLVMLLYTAVLTAKIFSYEAVVKTQEAIYHDFASMEFIPAKKLKFELAILPVDLYMTPIDLEELLTYFMPVLLYSVSENWALGESTVTAPDLFIDCDEKDENGNRIAFPNLTEE